MPLPTWMRPTRTDDRDVWKGKPLPARDTMLEELHYRIYDAATGELLSFNSTNSVDVLALDVARLTSEKPGRRLRVVRYDGPAYPTRGER